ncbi:MAG: NADH-quinone oxidoreductase subunit NuoK [Candidatus Gastranaerophilales bacterium]|nr:NADH-quinone oxidoreductase subunit NuoK [Candidatus Gastranaerophilales bacterium]
MFDVTLIHYLFLSAVLFCVGLLGVIVSRHLLRVLISVEFMLNAVNINFVAFSNYNDLIRLDGHIMAIFVMAIGVCELAIGLAILILVFRKTHSVDADGEYIEEEKWS